MIHTGVTTLTTFLFEEQRQFPHATGNFRSILEQVAFATKIISREVNKAGIVNILGSASSKNIHGEAQQKLDIFANTRMVQSLEYLGLLCGMASEEEADIIHIPDNYPKGKYLAVFDPLDGSSNIDVNINIGSIFGIFEKQGDRSEVTENDFLQNGRKILAAGYTVYGSSTMFVYSTGLGVNGFTLDPTVGEFILSHPNIKIPEAGKIYSANEGNYEKWTPEIQKYIYDLRNNTTRPYSARYIGSLVADFHRNLLKGGVFLYPGDKKNPKGKLRLLYEAIPLAFIVEQAGGKAVDGTQNILDIEPENIKYILNAEIGRAHV